MRTAFITIGSLCVGGLFLGIIGVLAWRDEKARRATIADAQVKRHGHSIHTSGEAKS